MTQFEPAEVAKRLNHCAIAVSDWLAGGCDVHDIPRPKIAALVAWTKETTAPVLTMKPLFIPLKTEFFRAFQAGSKTVEFRQYGPRWNERTCSVGRPVVLSHGYGKRERLQGVVSGFSVEVEPTQTDAWRRCYGDPAGSVAACISIRLS